VQLNTEVNEIQIKATTEPQHRAMFKMSHRWSKSLRREWLAQGSCGWGVKKVKFGIGDINGAGLRLFAMRILRQFTST
jgi:hypothetical protein